MLIAGFHLFVGFACGLRLTLAPFVIIMLAALLAIAILSFNESTILGEIGIVALAASCLQAGYVFGILVRARAG